MPIFEPVVERLVEYHLILEKAGKDPQTEPLLEEAYARLSQMDYLLDEIANREREHHDLDDKQKRRVTIPGELNKGAGISTASPTDLQLAFPPNEADRKNAIAFEIELFTEAFYWIGARLRTVVRLLPELKGFEAEGVRNTRNKLVEHPEKIHSLILPRSLAYGGKRGPVLKPSRAPEVVNLFPDEGLVPNAEQFRDNLVAALDRAIARITSDANG